MRMPNWFRKQLIQQIPPGRRDKIRGILESLLLTVESRNPKDFAVAVNIASNERAHWMLQRLDQIEQRAHLHFRDALNGTG